MTEIEWEHDHYSVQVGKGAKGAYKTRSTHCSPGAAYMNYNMLNIFGGYKKRLLCNGKVIERYISND